jgi:hypothetical protein
MWPVDTTVVATLAISEVSGERACRSAFAERASRCVYRTQIASMAWRAAAPDFSYRAATIRSGGGSDHA